MTARLRLCAAVLLLAIAALPARGQQPCTTEVYLYVEKSASASTRDEARAILGQIATPATVTLYSFAGSISTSTVARFTLPAAAIPGQQDPIDAALDSTILNAPSAATTDLLGVFNHLAANAQSTAQSPLGPTRRFFFVIADFAHAPITDRWRQNGAATLDRLRQTAVANQNIHLVAIQAPPPGPLPSDVHREITTPISRNFLFFEQSDASRTEIINLLQDRTTPLGLNLSPGPASTDASPTQVFLQVSNPTCQNLNPIVYRAVGENLAPTVLNLPCPTALPPGTGGGPCPVDLTFLRPLTPATGCVNLWIEAEGTVAGGLPRRGTAPQPITLGNCVEIDSAIHDLERKVDRSEEWAPYASLRRPPNTSGRERHATGLEVRGHLDVPEATLSWEQLGPTGTTQAFLGQQRIRSVDFNGTIFDGRSRDLLYLLPLTKTAARQLCLSGRQDEPTRLRARINWGTTQAAVDLIRTYPPDGEIPLHDPWESQVLIVLVLLTLSLFVANFLMPAELKRFSNVLLSLAGGLLLLGLASHYASRFGKVFEAGFAFQLEIASTVGLLLVWLVYLVLFLMGFFDQRPTAKECLEKVLESRLRHRRARRRFRTIVGLIVLTVPVLVTIALVVFLPKELAECRFTYSAVQQP